MSVYTPLKQGKNGQDFEYGVANRGLPRQDRGVDKVVAQVSNLLYRSASRLPAPRCTWRTGRGNVLPIGNRRYSRLETCATPNWPDFANGPAQGGLQRPIFFREFRKRLHGTLANV